MKKYKNNKPDLQKIIIASVAAFILGLSVLIGGTIFAIGINNAILIAAYISQSLIVTLGFLLLALSINGFIIILVDWEILKKSQ